MLIRADVEALVDLGVGGRQSLAILIRAIRGVWIAVGVGGRQSLAMLIANHTRARRVIEALAADKAPPC